MYLHYIPNDIHLQYKLTDPSYTYNENPFAQERVFII